MMSKMVSDAGAMDFVLTWVDGSDPDWLKEKKKYDGSGVSVDNQRKRYEDLGLLRYWFRGVEQCAPWVRRIYFVTFGHVPDWLNTSHEKLRVVDHWSFIPGAYLPTFNSNAIDVNLHRLPGLSDRFVYFNDDVFLLKRAVPEDFFIGELPRDLLAFQPVIANDEDGFMPYIYLNNSMILAKHFKKRPGVAKAPLHYFHPGYPPLYFCYNALELFFPKYTGFFTTHGPSPLRKDTIETIWKEEFLALDQTSKNRFRSRTDVSQYLFREWQKLSGDFVPSNIAKDLRHIPITDEKWKRQGLYQTIAKRKTKFLCIFEQYSPGETGKVKAGLKRAFEEAFPVKSGFER